MKKLKYLSLLIAFLLGGLLFPIYAKAQVVPSTNTFTVLENTAEQLFNFGFVPQSLLPYGDISTNTWDAWQTGGVLLNFDLSDCEITELNSNQKSELLSNWTIVNTSDITVTTTDKIYQVKMDNGYFTGYVYVDEDGEILSYTNDLGGQLLQVKYGGSIKNANDWKNLYESTATKIYDANFHYYYENPDTIPNAQTTFYCFQGVNQGGTNPVKAQELYIPNQYERGVVVPNASGQGTIISSWFANNVTDAVILNTVFSNSDNPAYDIFTITRGTYQKDNVTYNYLISRNSWTDVTSPNNTYENWRNYQNVRNVVFAVQSTSYNPGLLNSNEKSIAFKPLQLPQGSEIISYDDAYDYDAIQRLEQELNSLRQQVNSQFNNQQSLSDENFPFYYPANNVSISPSELPFTEPATPPISNPNVNPEITNPYDDLDPTNINDTIPIISGLQNKFPFSIPWDIYNLLHGLAVPREIPILEFEIDFPVIDYTWTPSIDLTMYDETAELFRTLFLILFIIGLAVFSYTHFFGS